MTNTPHDPPPILLPEADTPVVQEFAERNQELGWPVRVEQMSLDEAAKLVSSGEVSGVIAGAHHTTADVIRAGIKEFNPRRNAAGEVDPEGNRRLVSSYMIFKLPGAADDAEPYVFADPGVNPDPSAEGLVQIAFDTVTNMRKLGLTPRLAFLSYSTSGSADGVSPQKMALAKKLFSEQYPDVPAIGEVQLDAALDEAVYEKKTGQKFPGGQAPNILIFPNLDAANITYKAFQSPLVGKGMLAIGPLLQGFEGGKPWLDVSRGVKVDAFTETVRTALALADIQV